MSVEQHAAFTLDRCCLSVYQACDLFELTKNGYRDEQYLPLPCLDLDLVEISLLEVREPQLCWCCLIWVRSTQHYSHSKIRNALSGVNRTMIRSPVEKYNKSVSPSSPILLRPDLSELWQKHLHDVLVSVALSQREPNEALRWNSANQVHFVSHRLFWQRVVLARSIPAVRAEVGDRHPALVNIDYVCAVWVDLEHLTSIQVSKNSVLFRVTNVRDSLDATKAEVELLLQDSQNCTKRHFSSYVFARFKLDLLCIPDALLSLTRRLYCANDASLFTCPP